mmetsp:Transcript_15135/g.26829  ORF Transcript_15135/g.26829 Transcript_15135/m.26829 type:complete len:180 (+) Transcript_15135:117-656(+)
MARRGIANYDAPGNDQNDDRWWREIFGRDGVEDTSYLYTGKVKRLDNYVGMETTAQDQQRRPWDSARKGDPSCRHWHPARVVSESIGEPGRAGKSSWHHSSVKPFGCRVNMRQTASVNFDGNKCPHLTVTANHHKRPAMERTGFAAERHPVDKASHAATLKSETVNVFGFQHHYHRRLF